MFAAQRILLSLIAFLTLVAIPLGARANPMLLIDMSNYQVLYEEDAGHPWHPASLTKLMTAYVAFSAIKDGRASLDTRVIMSRAAINQAPSKSGLPLDATVSLRDALYIMLVKSANDVSVAIAETISGSQKNFVAEMNATAQRLGLTATHFENPHGLHHADQVTSARDLAVLSIALRQHFPQSLPIFETEIVVIGRTRLKTNNNLLTEFAGTTGMKTGYVCASGLNMVATAQRRGRALMAVVLGGSSARERGEQAAQLFLKGFAGELRGTGKSVLQLGNDISMAPMDMRPLICGKQAKAYVKKRQAEFPMGLKGQPSNLTDDVNGRVYKVAEVGSARIVPLPRHRPVHAPIYTAALPPTVEALEPGEVPPVPMPRLSR